MRSKSTFTGFIVVALAGLALLPTVASASPELTYPTGNRMAVNSRVRAHNTKLAETKLTDGGITIKCSTLEMTGTLATNTGTIFEVTVETAAFQGTGFKGDCTTGGSGDVKVTTNPTTNGLPWCLWSNAAIQQADQYQLSGEKCTGMAFRPIRLTLDFTASGMECVYEKLAGGIPGAFKTHPTDAVFTVIGIEFTKTGGAPLCPEPLFLDSEFTLEKDEVGTNPIYIS